MECKYNDKLTFELLSILFSIFGVCCTVYLMFFTKHGTVVCLIAIGLYALTIFTASCDLYEPIVLKDHFN